MQSLHELTRWLFCVAMRAFGPGPKNMRTPESSTPLVCHSFEISAEHRPKERGPALVTMNQPLRFSQKTIGFFVDCVSPTSVQPKVARSSGIFT